MSNNRYLIAFVIVTIIAIVVGQRFTEQRAKFRPPGEWFSNMQPSMDQSSMSYFEQSDQPAQEGQFQELYVDDYEPVGDSQFGGSKFVRHPSMDPPRFQSLCMTTRRDVKLNVDSDYEYRPESYVEERCSYPFGRMHQRNKVCGHHGFSCIQLNQTIFITKRAIGSDCWQVETRYIPSGCECMWPKHHKGDILKHH